MFDVRSAGKQDLQGIFGLFRGELKREPGVERISDHIRDFPSAVAEDDGLLIGFCYSVDFAPDVLELANIVVSHERQNTGIGSRLLAHVESQAATRFAAIILVNSDLYPSGKSKKRPATNFYMRHDYRILTSTQGTRIFFKDLR